MDISPTWDDFAPISSLRGVENQTEEICLVAVKAWGYDLQYVKDQTEEICLEAVGIMDHHFNMLSIKQRRCV